MSVCVYPPVDAMHAHECGSIEYMCGRFVVMHLKRFRSTHIPTVHAIRAGFEDVGHSTDARDMLKKCVFAICSCHVRH